MKLAVVFDLGDEELVEETLELLADPADKFEALADLGKGEYDFTAHAVPDFQ